MTTDIRSLIPAAVTTDESGNPLKYYDYRYPRSEAYEQAVRPLLPPGWELYSIIDHEKDPDGCARDYGATRADHRAYVTGYRYDNGQPRHLRACFRGQQHERMPDKTFQPEQLAEACRWADEQLAKHDQAVAAAAAAAEDKSRRYTLNVVTSPAESGFAATLEGEDIGPQYGATELAAIEAAFERWITLRFFEREGSAS